jgi:glycosyltransferase involved in cell wall biosynthesis
MKILYFHQHFALPSESGGTRSYEFARKLIERGHEVTMVCGGKPKSNLLGTSSAGTRRGIIDGIDVIQFDLPYKNDFGILKRAKVFLQFAWKSIKMAFSEDYDLLFATSTPITAGLPGIIMKLTGKKAKFVFEVRDLWPELPKALGMKNPILLGGMSIIEWLSYHTADGCIGLSPGICEGIKKRSQRKKPIVMIPNGCDLDLFKPTQKAPIKLDGIVSSDKVAIFAGAHGVANGLDDVLDAASEVLKMGRNDIKFVFIGGGKLKTHLIHRVEIEGLSNCLFYNAISKVELSGILPHADLGLQVLANIPAFYYGTSPNKFFDYISAGLPVLNNYPGWLADMISGNELGVVVEPNNPKDFAQKLVSVMDNPDFRLRAGKNSRKYAENNYSREMLSSKFVDFLETITSK